MVLGKFSLPGRRSYLENNRVRATALAAGAGGICWTFFSRIISSFSFLPESPI